MTITTKRPTEAATERLAALIETELARQGTTCQEAARKAMLPADAFRTVLKGRRPNIDRADELCTALGISMTIGVERDPTDRSQNDPDATGAAPGTG